MNALGRYGLWAPGRIWPEKGDDVAAVAREIEELGFGAFWVGGSPDDDLALVDEILGATGTLVVARLAAKAGPGPIVTMTSGSRRASSAARPGNRSGWPSAQRKTISRFCPST